MEGLLSTGPTPSTFHMHTTHNCLYILLVFVPAADAWLVSKAAFLNVDYLAQSKSQVVKKKIIVCF